MIARLSGKEEKKKEKKEPKGNREKKEKKEPKKEEKKKEEKKSVLDRITRNLSSTAIRKNGFQNFEHPETGLVFDTKTETVIGKQEDDGTVRELLSEDIEQCKRFKFLYKLPENLDPKTSIDDVKVEELNEKDEKDKKDDDVVIIVESGDEEESEVEEVDEEEE